MLPHHFLKLAALDQFFQPIGLVDIICVLIQEARGLIIQTSKGAPEVPHRSEQQFGAVPAVFVQVQAAFKGLDVINDFIHNVETGQCIQIDILFPHAV